MKKVIALVLILAILLSGCALSTPVDKQDNTHSREDEITPNPSGTNQPGDATGENNQQSGTTIPGQNGEYSPEIPEFNGLDDANLQRYAQDLIYKELVETLDDDQFFIENITTVYISQEYLDELAFNSQSNIFFGYTLAELDSQFQGARYVFTLGENGETGVQLFEEYYDDTFERVIRNVAIGTGVILVCVTVSVVSAGVGAPAISLIFATAAKTGTTYAISAGLVGGLSAGIIKGIETGGDFEEVIKAAALAGSEGFKWGAITGAVVGGVGETVALKGATLNGLTMNEAAAIQMESGYPLDVIKGFKSMDQYQICKEAGLKPVMVNGKVALVRPIDLDFVDDLGRTNLQRMQQGLAALDPTTGNPYQLHHIGQEVDSTLSILTRAEHMQGRNDLIWHNKDIESAVHGAANEASWARQRAAFWETMAEILTNGGI